MELRKEVLQFLGGVAGMETGIAALAVHQNALPRLIRRIAEELEEIYELKFGRDQRYVITFPPSRFPPHLLPEPPGPEKRKNAYSFYIDRTKKKIQP